MKALGNNVIIRVDKVAEKVGAIYKPESRKEKPATGVIVAVNEKSELKKGYKVFYKAYGAIELDPSLGKDLVAVDEDDLLLRFEEGEKDGRRN
jgi:co-chaperonin GroES (HSP10)